MTCSECSGVCCINPPQLKDLTEIDFAISKGVKLIVIEFLEGYLFAVAKKNNQCPFLGKEGNCSIYNERFAICREYECQALQLETEDILIRLIKKGITDMVLPFITPVNEAYSKPTLFSKVQVNEILARYGNHKFDIINDGDNEALKSYFMSDLSFVIDKVAQIKL